MSPIAPKPTRIHLLSATRVNETQTTSVTRFFPASEAAIVHQDGTRLTAPTKGVTVVLHTAENGQTPSCAEVISGRHYAEIGLWFEGNELSDYDGSFSLPREIAEMLADAGYGVGEECFL